MASAAEQLASSINFGAFAKATDLKNRIWFTLGALVIYRLGTYIPLPGIDSAVLSQVFQQSSGGILGMFDMFSGGALSRMTIFALNIMPYISSSIFFQIAAAVVPQVEKMQKDEEGRKKVEQWTRYGTVALAAVQGWGFALFAEGLSGVVANPGMAFRLEFTFFLTTGAVFVMWLGEQITENGIGNGASLMIFFSIVQRIWPSIGSAYTYVSTGALGAFSLLVVLVILVGVVAATVLITVGARKVLIQIPQRTMARGRMREASRSFIPLRINAAGVMPIVFAQSVIVVPAAIAQFMGNQRLKDMADLFNPGTWEYYLAFGVLNMFFTYFYTSIIFNPVDLAENLKKQGGFIPGVKPGSKTAEYIDAVVSRITLPGALFLTAIALFPIWLTEMVNVPFVFGGTSLLIVVGVALDTLQQMQQHLLLRKYDGFMKKGRVKFRGGASNLGGGF